jgi:hypothetical protein
VACAPSSLAAQEILWVDLMDESNFKWHRAFVVLVAVLFGAASGAVGGFEWRDRIQKNLDAQPKPRPVVMNPPPQLLPCNTVRDYAQEWDRTCRARFRSAQIGGKQ